MKCPPFISSAAFLRDRNELWVADPRRCSVTVHDVKGDREAVEIPLAPTIGRRYLQLSHAPGAPCVAASNLYARSGYLIDVGSKKVTPVPDLSLPWLPFRPMFYSLDGKGMWSLRPDGLVLLENSSGNVLKQFFFHHLFPESPASGGRTRPRQAAHMHRNRLIGCMARRVVISIGGDVLCAIDSSSGQWAFSLEAPRQVERNTLIRSGKNEIWAIHEKEAAIYEIPEN